MQAPPAHEQRQLNQTHPQTQVLDYLDDLTPLFMSGRLDGPTHIRRLGALLEGARISMPRGSWQDFIQTIRQHDSFNYLRQDPFTNRSLSKPRGYAGDAVMMDYIYQHPSTTQGIERCSSIGQKIFKYTTVSPASSAVLERRNLLAKIIDDTLLPFKGEGRALVIACGHLRELESSRAANSGMIRELVGVDQDSETISTVRSCGYGDWLLPVCGSVQDILTGKIELGSYDLIYTAGLFDYLPDSLCVKLLTRMKALLTNRGSLLVANFLEGIVDRGYMESCMDWWLMYRTEEGMSMIGKKAGLTPIVTADSGNQVVYLRHDPYAQIETSSYLKL